MNYIELDEFLLSALREDLGTGDITTNCCVPVNAVSKGSFRAKEDGIVCGTDILKRVFQLLDPDIKVSIYMADGSFVCKGNIIADIEGPSRSVLSGERVALNILQHLSGVATATYKAAECVKGTKARIADTRKTTPGMRVLEKYAVKTGGGSNHRFNLADGVLIKDNHIVAAGGIKAAVDAARANIPHTIKIEVETETMEQIAEAVEAGADIIMLDNMSIEQMKKAVEFINGRAVTEASGNMGERDLAEVAATGVDIISIGALTHTVKALDISLKFHD
jgi:nicotinate-nucleotide pyrophosphorylase (carboxylating)